jgi:cysteinyl-tRNA synthetase
VVNLTDVDDKLIRRAEQIGTTMPELAEQNIADFMHDSHALKVQPASIHPRVTDHMQDIIAFITELVDRGFAYASGGDVYFRTASFPEYGKLSHQPLAELQHGIRVGVDERKQSPHDFVLWKAAKPGEIFWSSPWGDGRPGWHIECSAMARKYLGDTLDIHGGGADLHFPHHECEVAQSESLTGQPLARYWMHNAFINLNNEKMSKSLGNIVNARELAARYKPEVIRYVMLSTHYRNPLNFSDESLEQARNGLERMANCRRNLKHRLENVPAGQARNEDADISATLARLDAIVRMFHAKMSDDFNTPDAITALFELVAETNALLGTAAPADAYVLQQIDTLFAQMDQVLGILPATEVDLLDADVERLIAERTQARKSRDFALADAIRDQLTAQGIMLEDTPQGIRWRRE